MNMIVAIKAVFRTILICLGLYNEPRQFIGGFHYDIPEPIYDFIDSEYVEECLVDLAYDYEVTKDKGNGLVKINIFHDRGIDVTNIEDILLHSQEKVAMFQNIECIIDKIKLEYPNFTYYIRSGINISQNLGDVRYGTQILRNRDNTPMN